MGVKRRFFLLVTFTFHEMANDSNRDVNNTLTLGWTICSCSGLSRLSDTGLRIAIAEPCGGGSERFF